MIRDRLDSNFFYYFDQGKALDSYMSFGSHLVKDENGKNIGVEFALYAPNACMVEVIGEWNFFAEGELKMEKIDDKGIWYLKIDRDDLENKRYKYVILTNDGRKLYKADPYAFHSALRPLQDSVIYDIDGYKWNDDIWMYTHPKITDKPMLIYEMHLGSWKRKGPGENDFYNYKEIAHMLVDYLKDYGYTHVEVMPPYEHPLDMSWGYQVTGYYAITPRYGSPKDFMEFIDILHQAGYGVVIDWVPGHICKDAHGLYMFDGTPLYEYERYEDRENETWGTANMDLGKGTTRSYLYSNAMYYMIYYHVDGFRLDAVSNIIYYLGNKDRGANQGAIEFLKQLSYHVFGKDDRVLVMAEDSSDYPKVTKSTEIDGLGFNYKWDMGWMNDTLKYFKKDPVYRKYHHHQLTFSMAYFYNEQYLLPLSHDEIVHMKGSLLNKMPGDQWQQMANYRLLIGYMMTHPGKKLLFMGNELCTYDEWHYESELYWDVKKYPNHDASIRFTRDMTNVYKHYAPLWELDYDPNGFKWIDADNQDYSVYVFARFSKTYGDHLIVVMNMTPNTYDNFRIGVCGDYMYEEVINSDWDIYGGSNRRNPIPITVEDIPFQKESRSMNITLAPLAIHVFKPINKPEEEAQEAKPAAKKATRTRKTTKKVM